MELAAKALELLATSAFKEAASWSGARDDLKKLENSIRMIQARVSDAEKYQEEEGSEVIKEWLRRLKLVLYQADDLVDHILTVGNQKQQRKQKKQVHLCSLRSSSLFLNWKMAREIKCIREQLDAIKSDIGGLNLRSYDHGSQHSVAHLLKKRETTSFVKAEDIVGRQDDKNVIIEMLFYPSYDAERVTVQR